MDNLIDALCAYALAPRPACSEVRALMVSAQPEHDLEKLVSRVPLSVWQLARRSAQAVEQLDIQLVAPWDLPGHLKRVAQPPLALFVRGPAATLYGSGEAIVGSRKASPGPIDWAQKQAAKVVAAGHTVISGGARGIDSKAHQVAWGGGGVGVVVLGVAVDRVYPASNRPLFSHVLRQGGAVVSEHPPLASTYSHHHATRNRLIAGLCSKLWIAEAGEQSGTLHTARAALKLGLPIRVPPHVTGGERAGIEWLLRQEGNVSVV